MSNLCKCGCGQEVNKNWVKGHYARVNNSWFNQKGKSLIEKYGKNKAEEILLERSKSLEERYGVEKANKIKEKFSLLHKGKQKSQKFKDFISNTQKGKTFEERFGIEKAKLIKQKISKKSKGTLEERFGMEKAILIKNKLSFAKKGKLKPYTEKGLKLVRERNKKYFIPKEKIIYDYINLVNQRGRITKTEYSKLTNYSVETAKHRFGSLDNLAIEANIPFAKANPKIWGHGGVRGKNEDIILDNIEKEKNIIIFRQVRIGRKIVDGYHNDTNTVYEVDENHHRFQKVKDEIREDKIKNMIKCNFIRINEKEFLQNIGQTNIDNFIKTGDDINVQ
jgi:hypothetical protein